MSPIGPTKDHTAIEIEPSEHIASPIDQLEEGAQAGLGAQIAFVGAKVLQTAGAVYTLGTDWTKGIVPSAALGALKSWLYYGKGVETEVEKRWAVLQGGSEEAAKKVLNAEAGSVISTGAWLGASSLVGSISRWFWGPTNLVIPSEQEAVCIEHRMVLFNQTGVASGSLPKLECSYAFQDGGKRLLSNCTMLEGDKLFYSACDSKIELVELPHSSWAQNIISFVSMCPAMKTLQEVSQVGVNTLGASIIKIFGDKELSAEEQNVENPAWKTRLAEISMGLGEAGMISYLAYSGAFTTTGLLAPLFILPPVFMSLLAKDEMEGSGNERLEKLREELTPLADKLQSEELTLEEQAALIAPFKERIEELQELQKNEKQAAGLFPKQHEWEELHDNGTNKVGATVYQVLRSAAGCCMPFVGIQGAFSTVHLLSSRAITALTGEEQLGRWALPVATTALAVLAQGYSWWG